MMTIENKNQFYPKVEEAFSQTGYIFYSESKIKGKGRSHLSKPDYIAAKNNFLIIGEIKSPNESVKSSSWRQPQNSDTAVFKTVRAEIKNKELNAEVSKEIGGHEIIILGQIPDYINKIGQTYILPKELKDYDIIKGGYSFPTRKTVDVDAAFENCHINVFDKIETGNGTTTVIYSL